MDKSLIWFVYWTITMSFIEYFGHKYFMHKKTFLDKILPWVFYNHAVLHHGVYHKTYNHEDDPVGKTIGVQLHAIPSLPIALIAALPLCYLSLECSLMLMLVIILHHKIANILHQEFHNPEKRFFSNWKIYKYLMYYHFLHHRQPKKNFNMVLPLADFIIGTVAKPSEKDIQIWKEIK